MTRFLRLLHTETTPDGGGDGGTGADDRPGWLPAQFESPEALAKSYDESRREMDRMRSQMDAERQQFTAAIESLQTPAPTAPAPGGQSFDPTLAAYEQAWQQGDTAAMLRLQAEYGTRTTVEAVGKVLDDRLGAMQPAIDANQAAAREASIRMAEDVVAKNIGPEKYAELLPKIRGLVADHPHYLPPASSVEGYASAILDVAKLAEHDTLAQRVASLEAERQEKLAAQTVSGGGRGSVYSKDEQKAEFERIRDTPLGDYRQVVG